MLPYIYEQFTKHINLKSIETIVHLGANDGSDWKQLIETYSPSVIISFECNPKLIPLCEEQLHIIEKTHPQTQIFFVPKAVFSSEQEISYWSVMADDPVNLGSSSIYKHTNLNMEKLSIEATTIDNECNNLDIKTIDIICADIEGGEIHAFTDQNILNKTRYIITEVGVDRNWKIGYPVLDDLKIVLEKYGFNLKEFVWWPHGIGLAGEALFVNEKIQSF